MIDRVLAWLGKHIPMSAERFGLWQTALVFLVSLVVLAGVFLLLWNSGVFAG